MGFIPSNEDSSSSFTLRTSTDCQIINPLNNQSLVYEGTVWRNKTLNIDKALNDLTDVTITDATENQIIKYNGDEWINADLTLPSFQSDYFYSIGQDSFIGGGTGLDPSYYSYDSNYKAICIDASFVTDWNSYYILLPTDLQNGSSIYIQITNAGTRGLLIKGGSNPQENIYVSSNFWVGGMGEPPEELTYKFTFYTPSSNNPWYGDTNYTVNSWMVETTNNYIPLSPSFTVHNIDTTHTGGKYRLPTGIAGQLLIIKDVNGHAESNNITLDLDNEVTIDGNSSDYVMNTNYESLMLICKSGADYTKINNSSSSSSSTALSSLTDVSVSNPSNDQLLVFTTAVDDGKWTPYTLTGATFNDTNKIITISGGSDTTQILTNKTIIDSSNIVSTNYLKSATTNIQISNAIAPTNTQILTALSGTSAMWKNFYVTAAPAVSFVTSNVTTFDMTLSNASAQKFLGNGCFDGRYIYYSSNTYPVATRYDTTASFSLQGSYSTFDMTPLSVNCKGYNMCLFDGRYVYYCGGSLGTRYDTTLAFNSTASYTTYSGTILVSASYDGTRYIYGITSAGVAVRYDNTLAYNSAGSYTLFNISSVTSGATFSSSVYDGRYIYYIPYAWPSYSGRVVRYDTTASFSSLSSYDAYDTSLAYATSKGFSGGVFDGRYIYMVPLRGTGGFGQITRYDTTANFSSSSSYAIFDMATINSTYVNYWGYGFDGRYLYLAPYTSGKVARYDTTASFTAPSSYAFIDTTTVTPTCHDFTGVIYDGNYMYISPYLNGITARIVANKTVNYNPANLTRSGIQTNLNLTLSSNIADCTITTPVSGNLLIYNGTAWTNSNTLSDNLLFIKDDVDGTKKLQFQLSGLTGNTTCILTVPNTTATTITGTDATQTLTNKTITDATNNVMAKSLKSATTTIDVSAATAPLTGQVLTATSSTTATWQSPSSSSLNTVAVSVTAPSTGQVLTATDSTNAVWQDITYTGGNAFTSISLMNNSYSVGIQAPVLSQNSLYIMPATATQNIGDTLTVNAYYAGINSLIWSNPKLLKIKTLEFGNESLVVSGEYSISAYTVDYVVFDITNLSTGTILNLPSVYAGYSTSFYLQVLGTQGAYTAGIKYGSNYIYKSNGFSIVGYPLSLNKTYKMTFYESSGNPYGTEYPSWTMDELTNNFLPLEKSMDLLICSTSNFNAITAQVELSSNTDDGKLIKIRDITGNLATTKVALNVPVDTTGIDYGASVTLQTNGLSRSYVFVKAFNSWYNI
jgi:hypothetical protein